MKTIVIDPGHGGADPGATGNGLQEKDITLDLARMLADRLKNYDANIILTRTGDYRLDERAEIDRQNRAFMANEADADLFFSIHINGHSNPAAAGYEDFIHPTAPQVTVQRRNVIHVPLAKVWTQAGRPNRGKKTANFQVLRQTRMSAILVEHGFITNPQDAELLKQGDFREKLVEAMEHGIVLALNLRIEAPAPITGTPILGEPQATIAQAQEWARQRRAHQRFIDIAPAYWELGIASGIRPEVAYAQSAKETAFGRYGGVVSPEMNNWAGIKTRQGGANEDINAHETFATPRDGVRAHFNHLAAYTGQEPIGEPHGRYHTVMTLSWAGTVKTVEELGGKWAPNPDYGNSIIRDFLSSLLATEAAPPPQLPKPDPQPDPPGDSIAKEMGFAGHWGEPYLTWAVEYGIMKGNAEGKIDPDQAVTNAALAVVLQRFYARQG